ncbi:Gfo/Idh/MocA family oxidoreductase [Pedobacter sp. L105]|uniref:Gfo/Idh/MocA family protein n=1 Tax=Pedobacter sp. L105 TaxID=1641871 RepID=UPI001575B348|nr:Gfo/Idh/MocA family oxidoreductase [Pedobacter sp. L105]
MSKPIITGLMSYGMSGRVFHAPFLATNPGFIFKAVVERHEKSASLKYPGLLSYNSIDELLNDDEIELIVVNTPNFTHFDFAKRALQAGKHVLIEKPAAVTGSEVKILFELGRLLNLQVMIYQNRRYNSDFLAVKEVIESGRLGNLIEVHFRIDRYRMAIGNKQFKESKEIPGNGLMYDLGSHLIDGAISILGKPLSYIKTTASHRPGSQVDDYFQFHLKYPNQLNVYLTGSLLIAEPEYGFVVHGTSGSFVKMRADVQEAQLAANVMPLDAGFGIEEAESAGKLVLIGHDNQKTVEWLLSPKGAYNQLFDEVNQSIRNHSSFPVSEEQILWQLEMLES